MPINTPGYTEGDFTYPRFYMTPEDAEVEVDLTSTMSGASAGYIFNVEQVGFYRVMYDRQNWDALTASLLQNFEDVDVLNRWEEYAN